ncbi:hypothetical protein HDE68_000881 [Pedobacter cryoconitis]|uniref:Uncharacterized protein n=1 Tax=Pedobacter cryoconitis TaxID=188932 RepID=A0A7W8ZJ40_9SPHI|nr:hypothetical protein [Pedobacter cryoconitis]
MPISPGLNVIRLCMLLSKLFIILGGYAQIPAKLYFDEIALYKNK